MEEVGAKRKPGRPRIRQLDETVKGEKKLGRPKIDKNNKVSVCVYLDKNIHNAGREQAISKGLSLSKLIENAIAIDAAREDAHLKLMAELHKELLELRKEFKDFETTMRNAIKID